MKRFNGIEDGPLKVIRKDGENQISVFFSGKSIVRDPSELLQPALFELLEEAEDTGSRLVLDFSSLEYMNSSTFTPLVKTLERARLGKASVTVIYDQNAKWQTVSFTALMIFDSDDGRVTVKGISE